MVHCGGDVEFTDGEVEHGRLASLVVLMASGFAFGCAKDTVEFFNAGIGASAIPGGRGFPLGDFQIMLAHGLKEALARVMLPLCGNNVRNRYSGCVFSVKDIVPVPLNTSRNRTL